MTTVNAFFLFGNLKEELDPLRVVPRAYGTWTQQVKQPCRYLIHIFPAVHIQIGRLMSAESGK
jgi:hypothetical protein